jgi:hypothetical protein
VNEHDIPARSRIFPVVMADAVDRDELPSGGEFTDPVPRDFLDEQAAAGEAQADEEADQQKKAFSPSIKFFNHLYSFRKPANSKNSLTAHSSLPAVGKEHCHSLHLLPPESGKFSLLFQSH